MTQRTIMGYPVVEVDMPEFKDGFIIFGDWSNLVTATNLSPSVSEHGILDTLCEAISASSPFGPDEVLRVYRIFKSFDLLVAGCEYAKNAGTSDLEASCRAVLKFTRSKP